MKNRTLPLKWGTIGFIGLGLLFIGLLISLAQPGDGDSGKNHDTAGRDRDSCFFDF